MPTYEQNKAHIKNYLAEQDEIRVRMPKKSGLKDTVQTHIARTGESMNAFALRAIWETMERDRSPNTAMVDGISPEYQAFMESYTKKAGE